MAEMSELQAEIQAASELKELLASLSAKIRRLSEIEAKYMVAIYEKREEKASRRAYRFNWMRECIVNHADHTTILASYLKLHPQQESEKKRSKKK